MKKRFLLPLSCAALFMTNTINAQLEYSPMAVPYSVAPTGINNSGTVVGVLDVHTYLLWKKGQEVEQIGELADNVMQTLFIQIGADNNKISALMFNNDTGKYEASLYDVNSQYWTNLGGMGGSMDRLTSSPYAMSTDSSTIVGLAYDSDKKARAFKWTQATGFVNLGSLIDRTMTRADAISGNNQVIGGWQDQEDGSRSGAYWVDGVEKIIKDDAGEWVGFVRSISYDGTKLAGNPLWGAYPYYYNRTTNKVTYIIGKGSTADFFYKGSINGMTADGKTVIGYFGSIRSSATEGFMWSEATGYVDFTDYVKSLGIDVQGEYLHPTAISPDGLKVTGSTKSKKLFRVDLTQYLAAQNANKTAIKIYPNPASNVLNISGLKADTKISIHNVAGQLVKTSTSSQIDINSLPKGNYVVSYEVDGKSTSQKFIKQ
ncbi:T9SS type A sorting domain-containing protein [Soonwooa sp.]|uniref:T9SS type A sorting domain-containing protein n=1 Tax=Soonwooa sp. TaxID=1938592 RepID=UPI0026087B17|nr:T9SS type A sorting domain-containing protein [Soonwooa sp.]